MRIGLGSDGLRSRKNEQTTAVESSKYVPTGTEHHETTQADGKASSVPILTPTNKESTNETMDDHKEGRRHEKDLLRGTLG